MRRRRRFVLPISEAQRSGKTGAAIPRGEFGLCDPRRSHITTGASVRLTSVAHTHPYSPRQRAQRGYEPRRFSGPRKPAADGQRRRGASQGGAESLTATAFRLKPEATKNLGGLKPASYLISQMPPARGVTVLGGRGRLERATRGGGAASSSRSAKRSGAGKPARRFLAASSASVIRVDPTPPPAHLCA